MKCRNKLNRSVWWKSTSSKSFPLFLQLSNQLNEKKRKKEEERQKELEASKREEERIKQELNEMNDKHEKYLPLSPFYL
jgi:hypothetical protein